MQNKFRGVMQSPVTPLKDDFSLDLPTFEKVLDFHVRTGATAISWPHHKGESLNLTIAERKLFAEAAVKVVNGRVPVTMHVSALAVEDTMELARHAQKIGADGILAITPYFWTPTREAIYDYFVRLVHVDRPAGAVLQLAELSRRRRDHRRADVAADRAAAEFRRRQGSELQQREVPGDFARGAHAAAGFRAAHRRRVPAAVGAARRRRLLLGRGLDLPEPVPALFDADMGLAPRVAVDNGA